MTEAVARCDETIQIEAVALGDEASGKAITSVDVLKMLYPAAVDSQGDLVVGSLPSNSILQAVLAEWNNEWAGASNAEKRYQCHGVITSDMMLDPESLLDQLGEAMGGWIVPVGSHYKFVAGAPTTPVATITDVQFRGAEPAWYPGRSYEDRVNSVRCSIAQNAKLDYDAFSLSEIVNFDDATEQGYRQIDIGSIPFQNSELAAQRIGTIQLRRQSSELLRSILTVNRGALWVNFSIEAGDRINLACWSKTMRPAASTSWRKLPATS